MLDVSEGIRLPMRAAYTRTPLYTSAMKVRTGDTSFLMTRTKQLRNESDDAVAFR